MVRRKPHIGVEGPLAGRLFAERVGQSGATLSLAGNHMRVAEPEFAFRMARDLPPRSRRALLTLAEDLLDAPRLRLRGIQHGRILEGLITRRLADL